MNPIYRYEYLKDATVNLGTSFMIEKLFEAYPDANDAPADLLNHELKLYREKVSNRQGDISDLFQSWLNCPYQLLKNFGLRFAACHASSANTERVLSTLNCLITPRRNRLNISLAEDLLSLKIFEDSARKTTIIAKEYSARDSHLDEEGIDIENGLDDISDPLDENIEGIREPDDDAMAALLDSATLSEASELSEPVPVTVLPEYLNFRRNIDYNQATVQQNPRQGQPEGPRRTSAERAQEYMRKRSQQS